MPDPNNSVAVTAGSLVVTGTLTAFVAAEYDLFVLDGVVGVVQSRQSSTQITLKYPWAGPTQTGQLDWLIVNTGPYWQSVVTTNKQMSALLSKWESGPFKWDASGSLTGRDAYNNQPAGFAYLSVDPLPFTLFVKQANTNSSSDWSLGNALDGRLLDSTFADIRASIAEAQAGTSASKALTPQGGAALLSARIGTTVQGYDVELAAIAALTSAADRLAYFTGAGAASLATFTAFARSLLDDIDAATARGTLGLGSAALLAAGSAGGAATLDGSTGKLLAAQVPDALLGSIRYQGGWNASTNSPALPAPAAANKGWYYIVLTAGTTSQPGPSGAITDWQIGDWAVSDGTYWEKVDSSDQVISVAGLQGAISATALRTALSLVIGTNVQAWDADLDAIAALATTAIGRSLLAIADQGAGRTILGAQAALGFAPVQQGTGVGQQTNAIKIGYGTSGAPKLTVDATDFGEIWTEQRAAKSLGSSGYQKLPSGLIIQAGYSSSQTDTTITLPVAFPTAIMGVGGTISAAASTAALYSLIGQPASNSQINFYKRYVLNGGSVGTPTEGFYWLAIGY